MAKKLWRWSNAKEFSLTHFRIGKVFDEMPLKTTKPVLLAVLPPWSFPTHLMQRESFNNPEVAQDLNRLYYPILAKPEEYPHLGRRALEVLLEFEETAAFPIISYLFPDTGIPFLAHGYLPPYGDDKHPGFHDYAVKIGTNFEETKEHLREELSALTFKPMVFERAYTDDLETTQYLLMEANSKYDDANGSLNVKPKFPFYPLHSYLWSVYILTKQRVLGLKISRMLHQMRRQGFVDSLNGGVFRVSYKEDWSEPVFEKLLVDNAWYLYLLSQASFYSEDKSIFNLELKRQASFLLDKMKSFTGLFKHALLPHGQGVEGDPYLWTKKEILDILGPQLGEEFSAYSRISSKGNCRFKGLNILRFDPLMLHDALFLSKEEAVEKVIIPLQSYSKENKPEPLEEHQPITSEQALLALAFLSAYASTKQKDYLSVAKGIFEELKRHMIDGDEVLRTYTENGIPLGGNIEDHSYYTYLHLIMWALNEEREHPVDFVKSLIRDYWNENIKVFQDYRNNTWLGQRYPYSDEELDGINPFAALVVEAGLGAENEKGTTIRKEVLASFVKPISYEVERSGGYLKLVTPKDIVLYDNKEFPVESLLIGGIPTTYNGDMAVLVFLDEEGENVVHKKVVKTLEEPFTRHILSRGG